MDIKNIKDMVNLFFWRCLEFDSSYVNTIMMPSIQANSAVASLA